MVWLANRAILLWSQLVFPILPTLCNGNTPEARFTSTEGVHDVLVEEEATLPCVVDNLGGLAVIWSKVERNGAMSILFADREKISFDDRLSLSDAPSWDLVISDVNSDDSGEYRCSISSYPELAQRQTLNVKAPPSVTIVPDQEFYDPGSPIALSCNILEGNPTPTIVWRRLGQLLPDGRVFDNQSALIYFNVTEAHSGMYECAATNGIEPPDSAEIEIQVYYAPWVKADETDVSAKIGKDLVRMTCQYDALPVPDVNWLFNGHHIPAKNLVYSGKNHPFLDHPLTFLAWQRGEVFDIRRENHTETTLVIEHIIAEDFGSYKCEVENRLGTTSATIRLSERIPPTTKPTTTTTAQSPPAIPPGSKNTPAVDNAKSSGARLLQQLSTFTILWLWLLLLILPPG